MKTCEWCSGPISPTKYSRARHCSPACHHQAKKSRRRLRRSAIAKSNRLCAKCRGPIPTKKNLYTKFCSKVCAAPKGNQFYGKIFQPYLCTDCGAKQESLYPRTRCKDCAKIEERSRRHHGDRCRKYKVPYEPGIQPMRVFQEDGWICWLCKGWAPAELRGANLPLSPELDHKVDLALPGSPGHVRINVACAHRKCNEPREKRRLLEKRA
jgi:hypothetical protein